MTFQDHRGWRPRYVNGAELPDWLTGPLVHDYLNLTGRGGLGAGGEHERADRFYGAADGLQLYFKRRR